jgi:hypothetical protein
VHWYTLLPTSAKVKAWNTVVLMLLLYTATFVPVRTCFLDDRFFEQNNLQWFTTLEYVVDGMYIFDFFLQFFIAFEDSDGKIQPNITLIARNYIQSWFLFDLLACVPWQLVEPPDMTDRAVFVTTTKTDRETGEVETITFEAHDALRQPKVFKVLRVLRLLKLIRLIKYQRSMTRIMQGMKINQGVKRMMTVTISMLFMVHFMSCLFFLLAKLDDFQPTCWVVRHDKLNEPWYRQYLFGAAWAL